jgi:hypothetical protein
MRDGRLEVGVRSDVCPLASGLLGQGPPTVFVAAVTTQNPRPMSPQSTCPEGFSRPLHLKTRQPAVALR